MTRDQTEISKETAVLIATGFLWVDYDLRYAKIETADDGKNWKVKFILKHGNNPSVWVRKVGGEIEKIDVPK
ncbi:MAG: hypothetical protein R2684_10035 [Pyrinomonadaceae bacterium]